MADEIEWIIESARGERWFNVTDIIQVTIPIDEICGRLLLIWYDYEQWEGMMDEEEEEVNVEDQEEETRWLPPTKKQHVAWVSLISFIIFK